jgi:hypothetical protein
MPGHKVRLVKFAPEEMAMEVPPEVEIKPNLTVGRGIYARQAAGEILPKAKFVVADDETLSITLADGRKLLVPLDWYPRLLHGTPTERNTWRLVQDGVAILWRDLEQVINIESVLCGQRSQESQSALRKWLAGRTAGKRKSA